MIRLCEDPLVSGERFVLNGGNYTYQELFTAIARVNGVQPPWWNLATLDDRTGMEDAGLLGIPFRI